jgi:hypothetical protein
MFNKIWSTNLNEYECSESNNCSYLSIKKFNLFIGVNNSGKSRLIRSLFISRKNEFAYNDDKILQTLERQIIPGMLEYRTLNDRDIQSTDAILPSEMRALMGGSPLTQEERNRLISKYNVAHRWITTGVAGNFLPHSQIRNKLEDEGYKRKDTRVDQVTNNQDRVYIPILRGMRPFEDSKDSYLRRTINDYFKGSVLEAALISSNPSDENRDHKVSIVTGLHLYELFTKHLLGKPEQRKAIARYEELLGN